MRDLSREGKGQLESLQVVRGLAALSILLFHLGVYYDHGAYLGGTPRFHVGFFSSGSLGIDCFFCLSGFIMAWVHGADLGKPERVARFVFRRFVRIYPAYVILVVVKLGYYLASGDWGSSSAPPLTRLLNALFLLPIQGGRYDELIVKVAWTLTYEVFFYALFALAIVVGLRLARWGIAVWVAAIVVYAAANPGGQAHAVWRPLDFVLSPYNLEFLAGVLACRLARIGAERSWHRFAGPGIVLAALAALAVWIGRGNCDGQSTAFLQKAGAGLVFGALLLGLVLAEGRIRLRAPGFFLFLGAASYSVYLVHFEAIQVLCRIAERSRLAANPTALGWGFVAIGVAALGAAFLYHRFVEVPAMAWCRKRLES